MKNAQQKEGVEFRGESSLEKDPLKMGWQNRLDERSLKAAAREIWPQPTDGSTLGSMVVHEPDAPQGRG